MEPIAMTLGQKFEVEKFSREIDSFDDVQQLRDLAKDLLVAWKQQQASTAWVIRQKEGLSSWWLESSVAGGLLVADNVFFSDDRIFSRWGYSSN